MKFEKFAILAVAFGLCATGAIAADNTGNAPGGTGIEESTESMGATDKQGGAGMPPSSGAGSAQSSGPSSADQGGTGIKGSAESRGATDKSTEDPNAPKPMSSTSAADDADADPSSKGTQ